MSRKWRGEGVVKLEAALALPEQKPDIERVLRVTYLPQTGKITALEGRTVIQGKVDVLVEYVGCNRDQSQPVHFAEFQLEFSQVLTFCRRKHAPDLAAQTQVAFQHVELSSRRCLVILLILETVLIKCSCGAAGAKPQVFTAAAACSKNPAWCWEHCMDQACACSICTVDNQE